jgi:hypothetical protein
MCAPIAIAAATFAVSAGSAIASHKAQGAAEKANREAAERAFKSNVTAIGRQQVEVEQDAAQRIFFTTRQARATRSLARVGAGESGVAGISAEAVLRDIEREAADVTRTTTKQSERDIAQLQFAKLNQTDLMKNRIAQVGKPSPLGLGLSIAGAGLNFAQFQIQDRVPASPDVKE